MSIELDNFGVYIIETTATGRVYIGSTAGSFASRLGGHKMMLDRGIHNNKLMQQDWERYSPSAFVFRPLEICTTSEQAAVREMEWIEVYTPNVYNYVSSRCPHCAASLSMGQYG